MTSPPKERGGPPTALKVAKLPIAYRFSLFPQVFQWAQSSNSPVRFVRLARNESKSWRKRWPIRTAAALVRELRRLRAPTHFSFWRQRMSDIAIAKRRLPLPTLMHQFGLREHAKKSARCPFHKDQHNSFSVYKNAAANSVSSVSRGAAKATKSRSSNCTTEFPTKRRQGSFLKWLTVQHHSKAL